VASRLRDPAVLEFVAVTRSFRRSPWGRPRVALDAFSLRVPAGRVVAILGANGSGKSTALRIAAGLLRASAGCCRLWGNAAPNRNEYSRIRYVPDVCGLPGFLSVRGVLGVVARLDGGRGAPDARAAEALLARVGLAGREDQRVDELSRGQTQRLGLAAALVGEPDLLLLDEPLSALDDDGACRMVGLLAALRAEGRTVLLTAHRSPELRDLCDGMVWLREGRVAEEHTWTR